VLDKITFRINNMSEEIKKDNYSADSIQALEGMEHVRMRPSMWRCGYSRTASFSL
jgi:DNA gyrase subunit B